METQKQHIFQAIVFLWGILRQRNPHSWPYFLEVLCLPLTATGQPSAKHPGRTGIEFAKPPLWSVGGRRSVTRLPSPACTFLMHSTSMVAWQSGKKPVDKCSEDLQFYSFHLTVMWMNKSLPKMNFLARPRESAAGHSKAGRAYPYFINLNTAPRLLSWKWSLEAYPMLWTQTYTSSCLSSWRGSGGFYSRHCKWRAGTLHQTMRNIYSSICPCFHTALVT